MLEGETMVFQLYFKGYSKVTQYGITVDYWNVEWWYFNAEIMILNRTAAIDVQRITDGCGTNKPVND